MRRRFALISVLAVLAAASGFAQIIGFPGQYPGQGRRYPGQQGPYPGQQQMNTTNLVGQLRSISSTAANGTMVIDTDDKRTITISLEKRTKFVDPSGRNAKITDFQPGDHVEADCIQDNNDNYRATKVTQLRVGTPEERAAASGTSNTSSAVGAPPPDDDNDPDRPRLHRAGEGDSTPTRTDSTLNTSPSTGRPSLISGNSGASDDDTPDPSPRRRRAVSSGPDDGFSPAGSSSSTPSRAYSPAASSGNAPAPQLARSSPPPFPAAAPAPVPVSSEAYAPASGPAPAYFAKQTITKTLASSGGPHAATWKPVNTLTSDYIYRPGGDEFGAILENVTPPGGAADLRNKREEAVHNHPAWRYDFTVPLARSRWHIMSAGVSYSPGYTGSIWIEKGTGNVLRIEASAQDLPDWFPVNLYQLSFDNNLVPLAGRQYLVPAHADTVSCLSSSKACTRNVTEFTDFRVQ